MTRVPDIDMGSKLDDGLESMEQGRRWAGVSVKAISYRPLLPHE